MRPICINHGCNEPVTYSRQNKDGSYRWRIHCSHCQAASYGKWEHRYGVLPFKTGRCNNQDGHLGFSCFIDWDNAPEWAKGITEVDHRDGNHSNNSPENLDELCMICHKLKGQKNGDFNNQRRFNKGSGKTKYTIDSRSMFERLFSGNEFDLLNR